MANRKYPRISDIKRWRGKKKLGGKCFMCGNDDPDTLVTLQTNWFRGDDEVFKAHELCVKGVSSQAMIERIYQS